MTPVHWSLTPLVGTQTLFLTDVVSLENKWPLKVLEITITLDKMETQYFSKVISTNVVAYYFKIIRLEKVLGEKKNLSLKYL